MRRPLVTGVLLGVLNAAVAVAALALVEMLTPDEFGWFAYAPLDDVVVRDPRFPWHYVAVPLALVLTNVLAVTAYLRRRLPGESRGKVRAAPHPSGDVASGSSSCSGRTSTGP